MCGATMQLPLASRVFGGVDKAAPRLVVRREKEVKRSLVVAKARCPLSSAVHRASLEVVERCIGYLRAYVANSFPIHKIFRMHNRHCWH